ncbi:DELTA-sagatoxin-Srs1a-like [Chanos chanos]|uniref:DELTA-sagatoxin-Srs1a-like n=1 Tax=Chanos chanos TaxID=29144 RepID=A0A6J2US47_CHACN|nr:DELTA-sagatoxin-Srs1a-like [Chanos chanos]
MWMHSGYNSHPSSPTVDTNTTEICSFSKTAGAARGAVGVLTYELLKKRKHHSEDLESCHCNEQVAIMFSVPYDYNLYDNWLAVGIFENARPCDETLFKLMYYECGSTFTRAKAKDCGAVYVGKSVEIRASMSNAGRATLKVEVCDKR